MTLTPTSPPEALVAAASAHPGVSEAGEWQGLSGGRTNLLWQVGTGPDSIVVKLYRADGATPLFPNDPAAEFVALTALAPDRLAPEPLAQLSGTFGHAVIYRFLEGTAAVPDPAGLARLLSRVHERPLIASLRTVPSGTQQLLRQSDALAALVPDALPRRFADLRQHLDRSEPVVSPDPKFLHADPVGANVVATRHGPALIDWQCPGTGDPCEDLAIVVSPSMRLAYPGGLRDEDIPAFLDAYPDPDVTRRYRKLAPVYHMRMAAYALWCDATGRGGGHAAVTLELDAAEAALSPIRTG
ncbi:aminoglycoside phosphotransferase family protein [Primorskyibacter flagellatus]|nr:aminoglycoside phosphotransferase family protein [Primorskyibacter flagellatus]